MEQKTLEHSAFQRAVMEEETSVGAQVLEVFERAKKAADRAVLNADADADVRRCLDALHSLRLLPITFTILISTQVGKKLRSLTKHPQKQISVAASNIVEDWKKLVSETCHTNLNQHKEVGDTQLKAVKVDDKKDKGEKKSVVVKRVQEDLNCTSENTISSACSSNQPLKLTTMIKCNDATRDKFREILHDTFCKVEKEVQGQELKKRINACDPIRMSVAVESLMFEKLGASNGAQKMKYRSIVFNLKDAKNPDLRRRVLLGEIKPEKLILMTPEEMASDQRKQENQQIKEKALFECERGQQQSATTDQFKCGKCGKRKCTYFQMQTRSADEPMTTFVTCVNCNKRWKFC